MAVGGGGEDDGAHAACLLVHFEAADGVVAGLEGRDEGGWDLGVADYFGCGEGREEGGEEGGEHGEVG